MLTMPVGALWPVSCLLLAAGLVLYPAAPAQRPSRQSSPVPRRVVAASAGVGAAAVLLGLPWWAAIAGSATAGLLVKLMPQRPAAPTDLEIRRLAGLLDLLAGCLDAGMPVGLALPEVLGRAGELGTGTAAIQALREVAALLAVGAAASDAWASAADDRLLASFATAATRSAVGGVRLAETTREHAMELRGMVRLRGRQRAARAGVAMTAPLTLCFLPAFVCIGLAPVLVSLVSTLQIW